MSNLLLAKRRALRRRSSSGGTMFVVAMTIAVLSTIGAWALQSAALEVRMAGFERQSSQTHYLSEYGLLATIDDLQVDGTPGAQKIVAWAMCGAGVAGAGGGTTNYHAACLSLPCLVFPTAGGAVTVDPACPDVQGAMGVAKACYRWEGWSSFGGGFPTAAATTLMDVEDAGIPGSLGQTSMTGTFSTEITEVAPGPSTIAGFSNTCAPGAMCSYFATVTSYGQTSAQTSATSTTASQGSEILRARIEIGPMPTVAKGNCQ